MHRHHARDHLVQRLDVRLRYAALRANLVHETRHEPNDVRARFRHFLFVETALRVETVTFSNAEKNLR